MLVPSSLSLLNHTFREPRARARAIGFYLAGASLALSGGPLVGGVLISTLGWRSIFFINVPVAIAGVYLTQPVRTRNATGERPGRRSAGPDRGGRRARRAGDRDDRGRGARLRRSARARRVRRVRGGRGELRDDRAPLGPSDAAARAVSLADVQRLRRDRARDQHRVLRADLRLQPAVPARTASVAAADRSRAGADHGRRDARQPRLRADHAAGRPRRAVAAARCCSSRGAPGCWGSTPQRATPRWRRRCSRSASAAE